MRNLEYDKLMKGYKVSLALLQQVDEKAHAQFRRYAGLLESDGGRFSQLLKDLKTEFFMGEKQKAIGRTQRVVLSNKLSKEQGIMAYSPLDDYSLNLCYEHINPLFIIQKIFSLHSVSLGDLKQDGDEIWFFSCDKSFDDRDLVTHYSVHIEDGQLVIMARDEKTDNSKFVKVINIEEFKNALKSRAATL